MINTKSIKRSLAKKVPVLTVNFVDAIRSSGVLNDEQISMFKFDDSLKKLIEVLKRDLKYDILSDSTQWMFDRKLRDFKVYSGNGDMQLELGHSFNPDENAKDFKNAKKAFKDFEKEWKGVKFKMKEGTHDNPFIPED